MNLFKIFLLFFLTLIIGIFSLGLTVAYISPFSLPNYAQALFYGSIVIILFSFFSIIGILIRYLLADRVELKLFAIPAMRQALIMGIIGGIVFYFFHMKYFSLVNLILLIITGITIEFIFYIYKKI